MSKLTMNVVKQCLAVGTYWRLTKAWHKFTADGELQEDLSHGGLGYLRKRVDKVSEIAWEYQEGPKKGQRTYLPWPRMKDIVQFDGMSITVISNDGWCMLRYEKQPS